jgi:hypothetical protein
VVQAGLYLPPWRRRLKLPISTLLQSLARPTPRSS